MNSPYSNEFLNQYTVENYQVPKYAGIGGGVGAIGGAGLGALFAALSGASAPVGALIGAPLGAIAGINIGVNSRRRNADAERSAAFAELSPVEQQAVIEAFANDMNASAKDVGMDAGFEQWLAQDPQGFQQFMLKNM